MRRYLIAFVAAFGLGCVASSVSPYSERKASASGLVDQETRTKSARDTDLVSAYQDLMLSEEDKLQLLLDEANTLSSLLGLVEKRCASGCYIQSDYEPLTAKLAAKYPEEALRYYAARPTNAHWNKEMFEQIVFQWAKLDWVACVSYLNQSDLLSTRDFCGWWGRLAEERMVENPHECVQQFRQLTAEKQQALMEESHLSLELKALLAPLIEDPHFRYQKQEEVRAEQDRRENVTPEEKTKPPSAGEHEQERYKALRKQWDKDPPSIEVLAETMQGFQDRARRHELLSVVLQPRRNPVENSTDWLKRVSESLKAVGDIPVDPPSFPSDEKDTYKQAFKDWLPQQSPRWQRAWAENVVNREHPTYAMEWIEGLATTSLRQDMRDHVLDSWSIREPESAAAYLVEKTSAIEQSSHLPAAIHAWALRDYESAKRWIEAQPESDAKTQALQKISGQ